MERIFKFQALECPRENLQQMTVILRVFQHLANFPEDEEGLDAFLNYGFASLISLTWLCCSFHAKIKSLKSGQFVR